MSSEVPRGRSGRCSHAAGGVPRTRPAGHLVRIAEDIRLDRTDGSPMTALDVLDPRLSTLRARLRGRTDP